jgi:hypothetical protein
MTAGRPLTVWWVILMRCIPAGGRVVNWIQVPEFQLFLLQTFFRKNDRNVRNSSIADISDISDINIKWLGLFLPS